MILYDILEIMTVVLAWLVCAGSRKFEAGRVHTFLRVRDWLVYRAFLSDFVSCVRLCYKFSQKKFVMESIFKQA